MKIFKKITHLKNNNNKEMKSSRNRNSNNKMFLK